MARQKGSRSGRCPIGLVIFRAERYRTKDEHVNERKSGRVPVYLP
jgi:hypothetical protein